MTDSTPLREAALAGTPARRLVLIPLFAGSGLSALVYEVVWLQLLQLVIGSTAVSLGLLLGTFMGGMCLGSLLLPRLITPKRNPLRVYALLELGVGALAIAVLHGLPHLEKVYAGFAGGGWGASLAVRGLLCAACLLAPAMLMGATLPAISRWIGSAAEGVPWLGFLYGANIAGAVAGCLVAGFWLLRVYDMATATYVAVAVNVAVSALSLALSLVLPYRPPAEQGAREPARESLSGGPGDVEDSEDAGTVHLVIALSGLTALGAEVVWTRLLSLLLGGTVYAFSIILAMFLLGLGLGSAAGAVLSKTRRPRRALGYCQLALVGGIAWAAFALSESLPFWPINPAISTSPWFTFQTDLLLCAWVVMPAALFWGASFSLALAAAAQRGKDPGRLVAGIYAANTVGAIAGALAFSLLLIPEIGTQGAQRMLLVLAAFSAALLLAPETRRPKLLAIEGGRPATFGPRAAAAWLPVLGLAAVTSLLVWCISPMPWPAVGYGRYCATYIPEACPGVLDANEIELLRFADAWHVTLRLSGGRIRYFPQSSGRAGQALMGAAEPVLTRWIETHRAELISVLQKGRCLARPEASSAAYGGGVASRYCSLVREGMNVAVAVSMDNNGYRYFHGAGKVQASTNPHDMRLQRMLGHLTLLARPDPDSVRSVLVVACGAGVTAGAFVPYDSVRRIVICDIEPAVPRYVTPMFARENYDVLKDPRTQVIVDDGRHFVLTTREKFDVITSDPIDPWVKGCAALNTREYYEMCKAHLNPGGVIALWFPLYESDLASARSGIATFFEVFPNGVLWSNDSTADGPDVVLFAQVDPAGKINVDRLQTWLDGHPKVLQSLTAVGFGARRPLGEAYGETPDVAVDLLATYAGQAGDMAGWLRGAQINTDMNLRLQYLAGLALDRNFSRQILDDILIHYRFPDNLVEGSVPRMAALKKVLAASGRRPSTGVSEPDDGL